MSIWYCDDINEIAEYDELSKKAFVFEDEYGRFISVYRYNNVWYSIRFMRFSYVGEL